MNHLNAHLQGITYRDAHIEECLRGYCSVLFAALVSNNVDVPHRLGGFSRTCLYSKIKQCMHRHLNWTWENNALPSICAVMCVCSGRAYQSIPASLSCVKLCVLQRVAHMEKQNLSVFHRNSHRKDKPLNHVCQIFKCTLCRKFCSLHRNFVEDTHGMLLRLLFSDEQLMPRLWKKPKLLAVCGFAVYRLHGIECLY